MMESQKVIKVSFNNKYIFVAEFSCFGKTFFGFRDGNKKTGQVSVDDSLFSRIFINSPN